MRDEIVKWLNQQANNHSVAARIASRKGMQKSEAAMAKTYEDAAEFLAGCTVEVPAMRETYNCPCGAGIEPCPDASGKPLCVTKMETKPWNVKPENSSTKSLQSGY